MRRLCLGKFLVAVLIPASLLRAGDPTTKPSPSAAIKLDNICKDDKLLHVGTTIVSPEEARLHETVRALRAAKYKLTSETTDRQALEAKIMSAVKSLDQMNSRFEQISAQLLSMKSGEAKNQVIEQANAMIGPAKRQQQLIDDLKAQKKKQVDSQSTYVGLVLDAQDKAQSVSHVYDPPAKDAALSAAIAQFNLTAHFKVKLGPSSQFAEDLAFIEKCRHDVSSADIPLVPGESTPTVQVVLNGSLTENMIWDSGASLVSLSASTAKKLGLRPLASDKSVELTIANGKKVTAKLAMLDSIRVGTFTVQHVQCVVMPIDASGDDLLGDTFQEHFLVKMDMGAGKLHLTPLDPNPNGAKSATTKESTPATPVPPDSDSPVVVKFDGGATDMSVLAEGAKFFLNRKYEIENLPEELHGLSFTCRAGGKKAAAELDVPAGATVYVLCDSEKSENNGATALLTELKDSNWTRLPDADYTAKEKHDPIAVFKQTFTAQQHFSLSGPDWAGIVVASRYLQVKQ